MNGGPVLSDDTIQELLETRAGRAEIDARLRVWATTSRS